MQELVATHAPSPASSTGLASPARCFSFEGFLKKQGLTMTKVPYRNPVEAANDLAAERVQVYESAVAIVQPQISAGRVRLIAVTNTTRAPATPDIPTVGKPAMRS